VLLTQILSTRSASQKIAGAWLTRCRPGRHRYSSIHALAIYQRRPSCVGMLDGFLICSATLIGISQSDDELSARCETVLHTTMAEMDIYHAQKIQDFSNISREHLDGEIGLYEQVCLFDYLCIRHVDRS
jgi:hypothetical protein